MKKEMIDYSNYTVAEKPIINSTVVVCCECKNELSYTGRVKLLYPPLRVMACASCMLLYWQEQ